VSPYLTADQLARDLACRDLTDPGQGPHALQHIVDLAVRALTDRWGCVVRRCPGPRIVSIEDNYDDLGFTPDSASRDARYTRYVDAGRMLRSHASAMVPPALRALAADPIDDVLLVCPGIVYRRDAIDRLHTGTPHQLDLWRVSRRPVTDDDMNDMTSALVEALVPGRRWRTEPRIHPYTLRGRQVDVETEDGWIEVWESGIAHPTVLAQAGLGGGWHGLALGMGLDRFLMVRKGVPDIRLLRSADPRVVTQMLDLEPYRPFSTMPAVVRDLSVAVDADDNDEDLGDRVRDSLDAGSAMVEEVALVAETPYEDLPASAIDRMGMRPGQKNVLVRLVLRDLDRTLTDAEANGLRDSVYAALHQGGRQEWATDGRS